MIQKFYAVSPRTGALCTIEQGENIYFATRVQGNDPYTNQLFANRLNRMLGIIPAQAARMQAEVENAINGGCKA